MKIIDTDEGFALCEARGELHRIDMRLVGDHPVGTWLLTFLNAAREVLTVEAAAQVSSALQAVDLAMRGERGFDHLFSDLIDREPRLPAFLRNPPPTSGD